MKYDWHVWQSSVKSVKPLWAEDKPLTRNHWWTSVLHSWLWRTEVHRRFFESTNNFCLITPDENGTFVIIIVMYAGILLVKNAT